MTLVNRGLLEWSGGRDMNLHRTYRAKFLIESDDPDDGPQAVTYAADLPNVGASWTYGNDNDAYALCTPIVECEAIVKGEANYHWILSYEFTTKPWLACLTTQLTHPASQPDIISGSFVTYSERTNKRRRGDTGTGASGKIIHSSSLEPIWVDRDKNRATVSIQQTRINLELPMLTQMINTLNDAPLWGLPARCVKLRNTPWRRLVWGMCSYYFQRTLEFDIKYDTHDLTEVVDMGHRWLKIPQGGDHTYTGTAAALDNTNPENFTRAIDVRGNIQKPVPLDGQGNICKDPINHEHFIPTVELYDETNFLLLGIPSVLQ